MLQFVTAIIVAREVADDEDTIFLCLILFCKFISDQLKEVGVVDEVIWEPAQGETYENFPIMAG